jgi:UDP-N-acetylmuramyl tripeptide synthase
MNGCHIRVAVFTNFTQDHLDFHGDMDSYWAGQGQLFDWPRLQACGGEPGRCAGTSLAAALLRHAGLDVWTVGIDARARLAGIRPPSRPTPGPTHWHAL